MSKKNKALKQLIKAQMNAGVQGSALSQPSSNQGASTNVTQGQASAMPNIQNKDVAEMKLIKKDTNVSVLLIIAVVIALFVIFIIDRTNPFLLDLANKIFQII